ncbi:hypothetical protein RHECNPAF_890051 [Rhizobium etli CNPAF512]|nr:hypothetical protein RHECNPAF_890051 [Rhizobium etli CNPAF512]
MAEAPINGQAALCGNGRNARNGKADTAPPAEISAASRDLSLPALTIAFHVACSNAPNKTSRMTSSGKDRSGTAGRTGASPRRGKLLERQLRFARNAMPWSRMPCRLQYHPFNIQTMAGVSDNFYVRAICVQSTRSSQL